MMAATFASAKGVTFHRWGSISDFKFNFDWKSSADHLTTTMV